MLKKRQSGTSMVEVLITLMVLSVGLLGLAGMQLRGVQDNQRAMHRTIATVLAYDMGDRMRANQDGLSAYDGIDGPGSDPGCIESGCSPSQMAAYDAFEWGSAVRDALPGGVGQVSGNGDGTFDVRVMWDDDRTGTAGTGCEEGDLKCFVLNFRP